MASLTSNINLHLNELDLRGWTVIDQTQNTDWLIKLKAHALYLEQSQLFSSSQIKSKNHASSSLDIRNDKIFWIDRKLANKDEEVFINYFDQLLSDIKNYFRIGLTHYECHYAHYPAGHYYKKHTDQKEDYNQRFFSFVVYLNEDWPINCGGELVGYVNNTDQVLFDINPKMGTIVVFKSEIYHEVRQAQRSRYSITGWMRT